MRRAGWGLCSSVLWMSLTAAGAASAQSIEDLRHMSIDQLGEIDISSVTKTSEALSDAPAAIYVITHDDIVRSGATSLPEILRLAPNLQVAQSSPGHFVITAHGFNGNVGDQSFSNKLLVLIDGRSVYTPLYSGVYWDMQDVLPEDIDRIEVISGPGAALWGANAVNGVINIITRKAAQTQGGLVTVSAGNLETDVGLRYGGRIGDDLNYRFYVKDNLYNRTQTASGSTAHDGWSKPQGGFRFDWTPSAADAVTLQGDAYQGSDEQVGAPNEDIAGRNLTARWNHGWSDGSALQVQAYYDYTSRATQGGGSFYVNTYDLDVQHSFSLGPRNAIVWGGGMRFSQYGIHGTPTFYFQPPGRTLDLFDLFAQDSVSITRSATLILGLKLEEDAYAKFSALPSARLSWKPVDDVLLWAAVSRAIRSPTPFDHDVIEKIGSSIALYGDEDFEPETLTAYELGARVQPTKAVSFSVSGFYNAYDDLRSIQLAPTFFPLTWANRLKGDTWGVDAWGDYQALSWWRLSASFSALSERFGFKPGAGTSALVGVNQIGDDPTYQASLKSSMNIGRAVTLDGDLRYVSDLPSPRVPAYLELDATLGWNVSNRVRLSLSGFNLLHDRHQELPAPALPVQRSFVAGLEWRF